MVAPMVAVGLGPVRAVIGVEAVSSAPVVITGADWPGATTAGAAAMASADDVPGCADGIGRCVPCRMRPMSRNVCSRSSSLVEDDPAGCDRAAVDVRTRRIAVANTRIEFFSLKYHFYSSGNSCHSALGRQGSPCRLSWAVLSGDWLCVLMPGAGKTLPLSLSERPGSSSTNCARKKLSPIPDQPKACLFRLPLLASNLTMASGPERANS
jgi:hypothetical protein